MHKHHEFGPDMSVDMEIRDDVVAITINDDTVGSFGFVIKPQLHDFGEVSLDVTETAGYFPYAADLLDEE